MASAEWLTQLDRSVIAHADQLAVHLVYDRPWREAERPGLARTHFAERCVSDSVLESIIEAFREIGAYVELFEGERPFIEALASGRLTALGRKMHIAFNGIGWGIGDEAFMPGRKALVPLLADAYGMAPFNADAYGCALTVHKLHSFLVLAALGIRTPPTWGYHPVNGWVGPEPEPGTRVIAKSTYEASSVGVTDDSVFHVDEHTESRLRTLAASIGQLVTVQAFIPGAEVCVPVLSSTRIFVAPPVEAVIPRAPHPDGIMTLADTMRPDGYSHRKFSGPEPLMATLAATAKRVFTLLELRGLARFDFRVDRNEVPWLFDVAIEPGISEGGSAYRSFSLLGLDHRAFLRVALGASLVDWGLLQPTAHD
jgi:D-alanine-D-alanine ligase